MNKQAFTALTPVRHEPLRKWDIRLVCFAFTCCRWGKRAIRFLLPDPLVALVRSLMQQHHHLRAEGVTALFVSATGKPFSPSNFCRYWQQLLEKGHQAAVFPPRLLRHIFIDER